MAKESLRDAHETALLVVAPDEPGQLLSAILSTSQLATTPLGPCRISWAHTFEDGLAKLGAEPYEACLVDSSLGPGSVAFLRAAREHGWRRPLVFFTSVGEHDLQAAAHAAGASDIVTKTSISLNTLGRVIQAGIQRSRFDETLRFGEEMVRILVEGTRDYAICMLDREGRVLTWNQGAERITGYSSLDVVGHHVSMFFTEADRRDLKPAGFLRHAVLHGRHEEEGRRVRKDGTEYWVHSVLTPLYGDDGQLRGFSNVTRDVTRERAAASLQMHEGARLSQAFRSSPAGSSITTLADGTFLDANDAFCRIFGYTRHEVVGRRDTDFPGMWQSTADRDHLIAVLRTEGLYRDVERVVHDRDGNPRRVRVSASRMDVEGQPCAVSIVEDVTTKRFFEEQMAQRMARMREGERMAGTASWEWDIQTDATHWSPNFYALLGADPATKPGLDGYLGLVHEGDREGLRKTFLAVRAAPASFEHDHRVLRRDGTVAWMRVRGTVEAGPDGHAMRMVGSVQDVTAWRLAPGVPVLAAPSALAGLSTAKPQPAGQEVATVQDPPAAAGATAQGDPQATRAMSKVVLKGWHGGPKLILVRGSEEGTIFPLDTGRTSWMLGRGAEADVPLGKDPYVSRRSAGILHDGTGYFIEDLAPEKNGTYLNGRRLERHEIAALQDGDIVGVGGSLLVFRSA